MPVRPRDQIVRIVCALILCGMILYVVKSALGIDLFKRQHATDLIDKPVDFLMRKFQ